MWPCNCYCAVARGHLGCTSSATGTGARWGRLERGHLGRSALNVGRVWHGLFSTWRGAHRSRARKGAEKLRAHIRNETQVFKRTQHLATQRKTTKYPIALFNPPSHDGGYHNGAYCIPARGHLGRSAVKVDGTCQRLFSTRSGARRSRARKGADGRIPAEKPGQHKPHQRAVDCAPYLTLYASGVKDWSRSFWSAVLQHRFRFG